MKRMVMPQLLAVFAVAVVASAALASGHGAPCAPPCCDEIKPICRPEIAIRKVPKVYYDCKCEPFCLPKCICPKFGGCCNKGCDPCCPEPCPMPCAECEKPRSRKVLIKYIKECDEPYVKCTPELVLVPKCCPAPCPPPCGYGAPVIVSPHAPAAPAKPAELLPAPKIEGK